MTELILTTTERLRMHEDQRIAAEFRAMRETYPSASAGRIMQSIAASGNFKVKSFYGVRAALIRTGAFVPETRKNA